MTLFCTDAVLKKKPVLPSNDVPTSTHSILSTFRTALWSSGGLLDCQTLVLGSMLRANGETHFILNFHKFAALFCAVLSRIDAKR